MTRRKGVGVYAPTLTTCSIGSGTLRSDVRWEGAMSCVCALGPSIYNLTTSVMTACVVSSVKTCNVQCSRNKSPRIGRITSIRFSFSFSLSLCLTASPVENWEKRKYSSAKCLIWEGERDFQGDPAPERKRKSETEPNCIQEQSRWEYVGNNLILKTLQARKDSERVKEREVEVERGG